MWKITKAETTIWDPELHNIKYNVTISNGQLNLPIVVSIGNHYGCWLVTNDSIKHVISCFGGMITRSIAEGLARTWVESNVLKVLNQEPSSPQQTTESVINSIKDITIDIDPLRRSNPIKQWSDLFTAYAFYPSYEVDMVKDVIELKEYVINMLETTTFNPALLPSFQQRYTYTDQIGIFRDQLKKCIDIISKGL